MTTPPTGTITFLFTDIEGSTTLWENHPDAMKPALARHDALLREAIESRGGYVFKTVGDAFYAAFNEPTDALQSALAIQQALLAEKWDAAIGAIRVRAALHTGAAEERGGDYFGTSLNRVARLLSAGHGGQVLISSATAELVSGRAPDGISLLDLGEHRFKGLTRADRVFQLLHPDLPAEFPPIVSLDFYPNNLPVQLTSFVGRDSELAEARQRLSEAHLLTLIGPGGTGKTRLSIQLGAELLPEFADGVWLVELAPLADPGLIPQTVAGVFGLQEQPGLPLLEMVINYVRAKHLLLILDNCEHLVEASARLAEPLLQAAPHLKIVASSREALGISGEAIYRVPSLSLPDQAGSTADSLSLCESARLFVERAQASNPSFSLTDQNAPAIAQICLRLDGIPLALELAAARATVLPAEQIAERLDNRFKLLTGGSRTALPRQQTLRALIDWSYDILDESERALLRRLSVFAGGWTFEAAEAIGGDLDTLDLLTQLVNKSLVVMEDKSGRTRYRMLETIRQYARDKLLDQGESAAARRLHLDYFVHLAQSEGQRINIFAQTRGALDEIEADHDNFRAALEWGLEEDPESTLLIVSPLTPFWFRRGHLLEGLEWTEKALSRLEALPPAAGDAAARRTRLLAEGWATLANLAYALGDNQRASQAGKHCVELAREVGDDRLMAMGLSYGGSAATMMGNMDEAGPMLEEALSLARQSGNMQWLGMTLGMAAQYYALGGHDYKKAVALQSEGIAILESAAPGSWAVVMAQFAAGRSSMFMGDYATARQRFEKSRVVFEQMGDMHRVTMTDSELAHMDRYEGNYDKAEQAYRQTLKMWQKAGHRAAIAHQIECFGYLAKVDGRAERAVTLFAAAERLRAEIKMDMNAHERIEYDAALTELKAGIDAQAFTLAQATGKGISMDEAIDLAITEEHE
jgi:predicted ATPase/class 3 adenylate cyclase